MGLTRQRLATARVLALAVALAGAGCLALLIPPWAPAGPALPWWALAAGFAVTEACDVKVRLRREVQSVSLSEVPLVLGLLLADPGTLLSARAVGSALVFLLYRRQTLVKVAFNTGLVLAGAGAAAATVHLIVGLHGDGGDVGLRSGLAAVAGAVVAGLVDALALSVVVRWYEGPRPAAELVRWIAASLVPPAVVAVAGVVAALSFSDGTTAAILGFSWAVVLGALRFLRGVMDRHSSLERLYELSGALAVAAGPEEVVEWVLRRSSDLLRSAYSEVLLRTVDGDTVRWSTRPDEPVQGPQHLPAAGPDTPPTPLSGPEHLRAADPAAQALLGPRGLREAVLVPLRVDEGAEGHLLVGDRSSQERGFADADTRLLEIVANHASLALRNVRLIERLQVEARHDELTGLPNRLMFGELLAATARRSTDGGPPCIVMMLDFNGFKAINDTLGHQAGDDLLKVIAARLDAAAGGRAVVARLGGDEFAVLAIPGHRADRISVAGQGPAVRWAPSRSAQRGGDSGVEQVAEQVADRLQAQAEELAGRLLGVFDEPVALPGARLRVGGSLGIALGPRDGLDGSDLMRNADIAMYAAKAGGGGVRVFSTDLVEMTATSLTLASDLRDAVAQDQIGIVVQPLVDLDTGAVHSVEALARWRHPELGEIAPTALFAAAERSGQVSALSARILDRALALAAEQLAAGRAVRVAVNSAPRWLADGSLPEQVGLALARHGLPADLLCLEFTEGSVLTDPDRALQTLSRLRDMGVHLAVDDFGTGYSSLTYLSRLPVDQIKLDKAFAGRLHAGERDRAIAQSIVDLGRNLGLEVVGEGVTDAGTYRAMQEMGFAVAQGYLISRPVPPRELAGLVARLGVVDRQRSSRPVTARPPAPRPQPAAPTPAPTVTSAPTVTPAPTVGQAPTVRPAPAGDGRPGD